MTERTLDWLAEPATDRGIFFAESKDRWDFWSYDRLAVRARQFAHELHSRRIGVGDRVLILLSSTHEFFGAFFGAMWVGAVPAAFPPPAFLRNGSQYRDLILETAALVGASAVITTAGLAELLSCSTGMVIRCPEDIGSETLDHAMRGSDAAFLQFSSGSTRIPHAIPVSWEAIDANITAIFEWLSLSDLDVAASWLPLHHDMGLVGCALAPIRLGIDIRLMQPEHFIRDPLRWLNCFSEFGATISAAPSFALAHTLRRVGDSALADLDLSTWRAFIIGAERVEPRVLDAWVNRFGAVGFRRKALLPAYGMAEATLVATGVALEEEPRNVTVDRASLSPGRPVRLTGEGGAELVSCGRPVKDVSVAVVDDKGMRLPEGFLGEIEIRGASVTAGVVRSGDAGFLLGNELFPVGRFGDSIKSRGRWLFAEDVENAVAPLVGTARPIVLLGSADGLDMIVVLLDRRIAGEAERVGQTVVGLYEDHQVLVLSVGKAEIQRTTSRKPKRARMWQLFVATGFRDRLLWDSRDYEPRRTANERARRRAPR